MGGSNPTSVSPKRLSQNCDSLFEQYSAFKYIRGEQRQSDENDVRQRRIYRKCVAVLDRIVQIKYNGSIKYKYAYNGNGDFTSLNLYAYCGNNPVARSDDSVEFWNFVIGGAAGGVIAYNAAKQEGATGKDLALETAKADNPTKRANERGFALQ